MKHARLLQVEHCHEFQTWMRPLLLACRQQSTINTEGERLGTCGGLTRCIGVLTGCFTGSLAVLLRLQVLLSKLLASLSDSCPSGTGKTCKSMTLW